MTRAEAVNIIYEVINCNIIDEGIADNLREVCINIEDDSWEEKNDEED